MSPRSILLPLQRVAVDGDEAASLRRFVLDVGERLRRWEALGIGDQHTFAALGREVGAALAELGGGSASVNGAHAGEGEPGGGGD